MQGNSLGCVILFIRRLLAYIDIFQSKFKEGKYIRKEKRTVIHEGLEDKGSKWRIGKTEY
jgi:hypothetical protein